MSFLCLCFFFVQFCFVFNFLSLSVLVLYWIASMATFFFSCQTSSVNFWLLQTVFHHQNGHKRRQTSMQISNMAFWLCLTRIWWTRLLVQPPLHPLAQLSQSSMVFPSLISPHCHVYTKECSGIYSPFTPGCYPTW